MAFAVIFPYMKMSNINEILEDAFFNPSTCNAARRLLSYGVLDNILVEFNAFPLAGMDATNFATYAVYCKRHIEVALSQLDLFMPASYESIMSLLLGSAQAIEMCKPSLCWSLISTAADLCQNLGYHRINTMTKDTPEVRNSKIHVFWMIYVFDKTLSLRMGRASVIQDWDISLPFILPGDERGPEGGQMLAYWVKVARVQGQTYEKLFCPAAFLKSPEDRARTAAELVNDLNMAWFERGDACVTDFSGIVDFRKGVSRRKISTHCSPNETEVPSKRNILMQQPNFFDAADYIQGKFTPLIMNYPLAENLGSLERVQDIFFHSDVVMHYSTCALIQRAVSPDNVTFNQECLESSRAALVAHMRANAQFNIKGNEAIWSGYIQWVRDA